MTKGFAAIGSILLGSAVGMLCLLLFGYLIVPPLTIVVFIVLGILGVVTHSRQTNDGRFFSRRSFRPVGFAVSAVVTIALNFGLIWLIMLIAWR